MPNHSRKIDENEEDSFLIGIITKGKKKWFRDKRNERKEDLNLSLLF